MMKRSKAFYGPQALGNLVAPIATPICKRQGFAKASIILDWEKIVSPAFATFCEAVKISFPFQKQSQGTLHVRVPSAMALAVSYQEPEILDRVNRYYGYQAIAKLVIHQGPVSIRKSPPAQKVLTLCSDQATFLEATLQTLSDSPLRQALQGLGMNLLLRETL